MPPSHIVRRPRAIGVLVTAIAIGSASSCQVMRELATYRRIQAHEREFEHVDIAALAVHVDVMTAEKRARVSAEVTLRNHGDEPIERVRLLLAEHAQIESARCDEVDLGVESSVSRLGRFAVRIVEIDRLPAIASGEARTLHFDYTLTVATPTMSARIEPDDGFLLAESLWVPTLRTPLSESGRDRAPLALEIRLPATLTPVGIAEFEVVSESNGALIHRGATQFPFPAFFTYGRYEPAPADSSVAVFTHADSAAPAEAVRFVADAAREVRANFEELFGPIDLPRTKIVFIRRGGGSWGAPCCSLLDEGRFPRADWQQPSFFGLVAHELAHTWWGGQVAMHGRTGYLHEGLANWCSARAIGARYGDAARERAYEEWLFRYARDEHALGRSLSEVSILEDASYQPGAYLVGAHFYRALEERMGASFLRALRRLARECAQRSADFDDLRAACCAESSVPLDDLFEHWLDSEGASDELYERGRALIETRTAYWRAREPGPDAASIERARSMLERASAELDAIRAAALSPDERAARIRDRMSALGSSYDVQITLIDRDANLVFHSGGLTGSVLGHRDVRGTSVYGTIAAEPGPSGTLANFDFLSDDLRAARENSIAWRSVPALDLIAIAESHAWRAMEEPPAR